MISDEHESDLRLEQRLHEEFRRQLDGQVGRAAAYFIESCAAQESGRRSFRPARQFCSKSRITTDRRATTTGRLQDIPFGLKFI